MLPKVSFHTTALRLKYYRLFHSGVIEIIVKKGARSCLLDDLKLVNECL